ncbi:MAG: hypothetical protein QXT63_02610 [Thermoplasmata archaeon]
MKGEVIIIHTFDVGAVINLKKLKNILLEATKKDVEKKRAAPKYAAIPTAEYLHMPSVKLDTNIGVIDISVSARFFSQGAVTITMRTDFSVDKLSSLMKYYNIQIKEGGLDGGKNLLDYAVKIMDDFRVKIKDALEEPYSVHVEPRQYYVFSIYDSKKMPREFVEEDTREIAGLLRNEPSFLELSEEEIKDALKERHSYFSNDLAIIDWNAALIMEPKGEYEDTLLIIELANMQVVEMAAYNAYFDKVLQKAYDDIELAFSRAGKKQERAREMVRELREVRLDLIELTSDLFNAAMLFGDWYLAKLHRACLDKFDLEEYRELVIYKLDTLDKLFQIVKSETEQEASDREAKRGNLLEAIIVVLIVVEVLLFVWEIAK